MADLKARNLIARDLFPIPSDPTPEGLKCITLTIPDDIEHEAVFAGALALLTKWNSWQKDGTHNAADCANTWKAALDAGYEACMAVLTDVRQNEENPCTLEKQIDEGAWTEFANLQLCSPRIRTNAGRLQFWDGSDWIDLPDQGDEKFDGEADPPFPDPPVGETGNCLAAENLIALLAQQVGEWENALTIGAIALVIVTAITGVLAAFTIPFAVPAINAFAATLTGLGASALSAAFTEEVYDRFKCIIFCRASADGSITLEQYERIIEDVQDESGTAWDLIEVWIDFFGPVGLTRAGNAAGLTTGDCDECDCGTIYTITTNWGNSSESTVMDGDEFTVSSVLYPDDGSGPFSSCHLVNHYIEFTMSPPVKLEVLSVAGRSPSCVYGGSGAEWGIWSDYPSTRWYTSDSTPVGVFASDCELLALWNATPGVSVTFKVHSD